MGCMHSKRNINSLHPTLFEVINVDANGHKVCEGHLEVTDRDLILHQKNKTSTVWPFRSLRRYGADLDLFSFESGRRAPTGEGVYAFRCERASELFNQLQAQVTAEENATQSSAARTPDSLEPSTATPASAADFSPVGTVPLAEEESFRVDEDDSPCDDSNNNQHPYINFDIIEAVKFSSSKDDLAQVLSPVEVPTASYMNIDVTSNGDSEPISSLVRVESGVPVANGEVQRDHVYMNVVPGLENVLAAEQVVPPIGISIIAKPVPGVTLPYVPNVDPPGTDMTSRPLLRGKCLARLKIGKSSSEDVEDEAPWFGPSYSNLNPSETESPAPTNVNYAVLDLDQQPSPTAVTLTPVTCVSADPESPCSSTPALGTGYATIDFNKTEALSHSVNPNRMDVDREGCRKTRHNSTISDFPATLD